MEKDNNQKVADQKEVIRDLQDRITKSTDEDERKSLQLKLDVAEAKLKEIENEQRTEVETSATSEGVSQNTKIFHNALTDEEQLDEAKMTWKEQRANELRQRIKRAMVQRDKTKGDARAKWQEGINDMRRQLKKVLSEEFEDEKEEELKESIPEGYSKSKFFEKDVVTAIKDIERELSYAKHYTKDGKDAFAMLRGYFEAIESIAEQIKQNCKYLGNLDSKGMLAESMPNGYSKSKFLKEMKDAVKDVKELADKTNRFIEKGNLDDIRLMFKSIKGYCEMVEGNCQDIVNQEKKGVLTEGCMTKKFENMTNREVASYIFSHPHTKMKECDDKEILKAIRDMKKEMSEEAPVTNTSAVATAPKPSMYLKRPEQEELKDNQ